MKSLFKTVIVIALVYVGLLFFGPKHIQNGLKYWFSNVDDYKVFTNNTIQKSSSPKAWPISSDYNKKQLSAEDEK